jgi:succinyl-CoA synthetase alpha subunit/succinyl-CoA synthetase beta subunit
MFVEEHAAKQLLAGLAICVPGGRIAQTPAEAAQIAGELGVPVMVKGQVPTGKRGQGGCIKAAGTPVEAQQAAGDILGMILNDFVVEQVLVEAQATIVQELYAAVTHDPSRKCPLLIFSTEGGMDIETIHAATPEKVVMLPLDIRVGLDGSESLTVLQRAGLEAPWQETVAAILVKLYAMYRQFDAQLVEVNPLALTTGREVVALDCKLVIDDSAHYRQLDLPPEKPQGTALEMAAKAQNFLYIELDGDVGILANGAGLTMSTMDAVVVHGGRPANFMEVGGDAYRRAKPALALVLQNLKVKSLLVNLCGAYARTDVIIEGVVTAWQALQPDIPVAFCIHGTGEERAKALVQEQLGIEPYEQMDAAVKAAIRMARGDRSKGVKVPGSRGVDPQTQVSYPALKLPSSDRRVLVQGITGQEGTYWTKRMLEYGTKIVAGVTPGKGGQRINGIPVYNSVEDAGRHHHISLSVLFVPPRFVKDAALEAIEAGLEDLIILTEYVPVQDVIEVLAVAGKRGVRVIGPNSPGVVFPGRDFIGIMPGWAANLFQPGPVGVVSRSGSLGALICLNLVRAGIGQSAFIGIGGDPIPGTTFRDVLQIFEHDPHTRAIAMLGEIGGSMEEEAAQYIPEMTKPVVAFIAGKSAPEGKRMGHAGAMVSGSQGNAAAKIEILRQAGTHIAQVPSQINKLLVDLLGER